VESVNKIYLTGAKFVSYGCCVIPTSTSRIEVFDLVPGRETRDALHWYCCGRRGNRKMVGSNKHDLALRTVIRFRRIVAYNGQHSVCDVDWLITIVWTALYPSGHTKVGPTNVVVGECDTCAFHEPTISSARHRSLPSTSSLWKKPNA
jgi:hypothetical protein